MNEFADGGLHPGYAFPLWQAFLALIAKVAFVDPSKVVLHEATVLAPLAVLAAYEAGYALFRRVVPAAATAGAAVGIAAMAAGHGGSFTSLALPATSSRQLLVPAALALAFTAVRAPSKGLLASVGVASLVLAVVHPTYAIFLWIPFAGFLAVRWAWRCEKVGSGSLTLAALVVPAGLFLAWLLPVVRKTASVSPDAHERARGFEHYAGQLNGSADQFWVAPQVFGRSGAIAVAALLLIPFAVFASRRRWAAYVVGGSLAVFAITLVPWLFTPFSDVVSLSQSRRLAGFIPFSFALAGGMGVLAALIGRFVVPLALVAGIVLQWQYPGDFGYALHERRPRLGDVDRGRRGARRARRRPLAPALAGDDGCARLGARAAADLRLRALALVAVACPDGEPAHRRASSTKLRTVVPAADIVYSDPESSYEIAAAAPVYICVAPPGHVADTKQNQPYVRRDQWRFFNRTGDLAIPERCGARWLLIDRERSQLSPRSCRLSIAMLDIVLYSAPPCLSSDA